MNTSRQGRLLQRGEPLFVGKDVAKALGYSNTRKALLDHVDYEDKRDGVTIRDSIGRDQKAVVINESGLYSLILSSKPTGRNHHREEVQPLLAALRRETTDAAQPLQGDGHREAVRRQPPYFKTTTFLLF
jgi:prophage antirepressor-like protein